jgi:ribose-phosphate pyrophosphokinase
VIKVFTGETRPITFTTLKFAGGEMHVKITSTAEASLSGFTIHAHLHSSDDIMELALVTDAVRRKYNHPKIRLVCPYFPYARQDRVCAPGEALSVKVMADLIINALAFESVEVWDAHSDVTPALLNRVVNLGPEILARDLLINDPKTTLVSPDAGAIKKIHKVAETFKLPMIRADKIRDVNNGNILETVVYSGHVGDRHLLIVDDICDGGRTFTELAAVLRPLTRGHILLYVTHGIFSKGLDVFEGLIDHVYSPNPFDQELKHPLFTKI